MRVFVQIRSQRETEKSATTLILKLDDCSDRVPKEAKKITTASMSSSVFIIIAYTSFFSS